MWNIYVHRLGGIRPSAAAEMPRSQILTRETVANTMENEMSKHTPGTWYVAERTMWHAEVRFVRTSEDKSGVVGLTSDRDAKLVAAAPELLSALTNLLNWGREHTSPIDPNSPHELLVAAHEAIAKANGVKEETITPMPTGWRREFPGFDHDIDALAKRLKDEFGFYDSSWHNDACPSFSAIDDSLRIWVNWKNPDLREGWSHIYGIDLPGEEGSVFDTDDLEEAIAMIKALIAEKSERKVNPALEALRYHVTGAIERGEGVAITEQLADATITELIRDVKDGDCALSAIFDDGSTRKLFNFFIDELAFFDSDLIGKTETEAHQLHHDRTIAYIQS